MKFASKPVVVVRSSDRKSVYKSMFLKEAVFRKAVTAAEVKAGLRSKSLLQGA